MAQVDSESSIAMPAQPAGARFPSRSISIGRRGFLGRAAAALATAGTASPVAITAALTAPEEHPAARCRQAPGRPGRGIQGGRRPAGGCHSFG